MNFLKSVDVPFTTTVLAISYWKLMFTDLDYFLKQKTVTGHTTYSILNWEKMMSLNGECLQQAITKKKEQELLEKFEKGGHWLSTSYSHHPVITQLKGLVGETIMSSFADGVVFDESVLNEPLQKKLTWTITNLNATSVVAIETKIVFKETPLKTTADCSLKIEGVNMFARMAMMIPGVHTLIKNAFESTMDVNKLTQSIKTIS